MLDDSPILYTIKDAACLLYSVQAIALPILHLEYRTESPFTKRFESDEPLLKLVFLFRNISSGGRMRLSVMQCPMLLGRRKGR